MTKPARQYPAGPITPHGAYYLLKGRYPNVTLWAPDESIRFNLMGGRAIPDPTRPEAVHIKRDGLKGLVPPWETIDQKGATQDGTTFIDALYGPTEVEMKVVARGRDPQHLARVVRDLIGSVDAKRTSEFSFLTPDMSRWWADLRWFKTMPDNHTVGESNTQEVTLVMRADDAFYRSYDDVSEFRFSYDDDVDEFSVDTTEGLGDGWELNYFGTGGGYVRARKGQAMWVDDPDDPVTTNGRTVVFRRNSFTSTTDNQVIETVLGSFPEWSFPDNGSNELWGRMPATGLPGRTGVRVRFRFGWIRLSYFVDGVETVLRERPMLIPPMPGEKFSLICGYEGNPRMFKVLRNGLEVLSVKESGTGSMLGAAYRKAGGGMHAGAALLTQATPASMRKWNAADNKKVSQSGYLECVNIGDQPQYREYTLFGPGKFSIANGPDSTEMITMGPLLPNQVVYLRSDPRRRAIRDLTSVPPTPQELSDQQEALKKFLDFAVGNNLPELRQQIESKFGIVPPQGNLFSLLKGRFSTESAIPPKSPGHPAQPYYIKCSIDDGNADSKILCSGTPLRRYPN